jgi:hypothetical protein
MVLMIKPEPEEHFECPGDFEIVGVQQLKRIADALDRAYPKPEPEWEGKAKLTCTSESRSPRPAATS